MTLYAECECLTLQFEKILVHEQFLEPSLILLMDWPLFHSVTSPMTFDPQFRIRLLLKLSSKIRSRINNGFWLLNYSRNGKKIQVLPGGSFAIYQSGNGDNKPYDILVGVT